MNETLIANQPHRREYLPKIEIDTYKRCHFGCGHPVVLQGAGCDDCHFMAHSRCVNANHRSRQKDFSAAYRTFHDIVDLLAGNEVKYSCADTSMDAALCCLPHTATMQNS